MDDPTLWTAFTGRTLSHLEWTHRAHLRVAWMHLERWAADEAHLRMRAGIILLNAVHGLEESGTRGYFETLTRAWLALVDGARGIEPGATSERFLELHPSLLDRDAPLRFYSRERLASVEARSVLVAPDRAPLPRRSRA